MSDHLYCRGIQPVTNKKNTFFKIKFWKQFGIFCVFSEEEQIEQSTDEADPESVPEPGNYVFFTSYCSCFYTLFTILGLK